MVKRKTNKWVNLILMLAGAIALVGVGGLFINGTFLSTVLLEWLPQLVHTITGWILVVSGALTAVTGLWTSFTK